MERWNTGIVPVKPKKQPGTHTEKMETTSGVSRIPVRANRLTSSSSDTMETTTEMNGAANGSLVFKNIGMGSRIPKLFGKAARKQPPDGQNGSEPLEGSDDQPINGFETNQPIENGNTTNSAIGDNVIIDVINGTNGTSDWCENEVKFDVIVTMDTDGSDNDSNGMPRCLTEKFRHRSRTTSSTDGETANINGVHTPNGDPNGMPEYLKEKFRHRSGTMSSTDGETVDLNDVHPPNGDPNGMPQLLTEKLTHSSGTMSSTDGDTADISGVHVPNGDPIGVNNKIEIPKFFIEKIRHRSGGTVTDANGDLSEDVGSDGVVIVDIGGVGENKKVALRKRNTSASNGVDNNNITYLNGKPTEMMNNNDRNVEKNIETTNRKSKLPTLPRTFFVRRLENRFSSGDSFERPHAEHQNGVHEEDVKGTKIYVDDVRRTRNKSPESKIPVSKVTTKSPRKSPTVHVQQYSYFERKFVTTGNYHDDDKDNDYDAEDELDMTSHKGQSQEVKVISNVNDVNGEINYESYIDLDPIRDQARLDQRKDIAECEEEVNELNGKKIKNTNRSPNGSGLKPLTIHRGEVVSNDSQQDTLTKSEQWCNNVQANCDASGTRTQGRADCVAEKQNAFKGHLTDAYNQNAALYAVVGADNGKDEETGEADGNVHHPSMSNGPSCHKLVENHHQSQSQCVQRSGASAPHGKLKKSSNSQSSVHNDRLLPINGTSNEIQNLDDVENLENLEAEFMKALDAMDPPEPDVVETGSTRINQDEGLPHVRRLNGFRAGRSLCVEGIVNKNAKCFSINLQSTHANPQRTDVALMLSPSVEDKTVTANSFMYEAWGAAVELKKNFPFTEGRKFTVRIECESACYKIFVNDDWLMDYDHRMPLDKTCYVRLDGDAAFFNVECPHVLELPKIVDIPQGFRVGSNFQMDAFIWPKASSFEVNFLTGPVDKKDKKEPQASFSLRSLFNAGKTKVEMNCVCDGKAGEEGIVEGDLSLQPSQDVKLRIIAEEGNFKVEMDDFYFAEYDHKLPINKFTHAVIDGDISLYGVKVNRPSRRRMSTLRKASAGLKNENCCPCSIT